MTAAAGLERSVIEDIAEMEGVKCAFGRMEYSGFADAWKMEWIWEQVQFKHDHYSMGIFTCKPQYRVSLRDLCANRYCSQVRNALNCAFREKTYSLKCKNPFAKQILHGFLPLLERSEQ